MAEFRVEQRLGSWAGTPKSQLRAGGWQGADTLRWCLALARCPGPQCPRPGPPPYALRSSL